MSADLAQVRAILETLRGEANDLLAQQRKHLADAAECDRRAANCRALAEDARLAAARKTARIRTLKKEYAL